MTEIEMIQIVQGAIAQVTLIFGQITTITFAMVVAIFYFLNTAPLGLKIASFMLYTIGILTYFLLAVRQSAVASAVSNFYKEKPVEEIGPVILAMRDFGESTTSLVMNITMNFSAFALWAGVLYLLFFWKKPAEK
ncbi:MAG: hypothetical protein AAF742_00915 [Pseudomonadota bacterium]